MADIRSSIIDFYEKKAKSKTMFLFGDIYKGLKKICKDEGIEPVYKRKEVKKAIGKMVLDQELDYWSSGSTTYIKINKPIDELKKGSLEQKVDDKD